MISKTHSQRLDKEDFEIQIKAAIISMYKGFYATAIAELRGAIMILNKMQKIKDQ